MLPTAASSEVLAHWHYTPDEWRDFVHDEAKQFEKVFKSLRYGIIGIIVIAVPLVIALLLIPLWLMGSKWGPDVYGPVFGVTFFAGFFLAVLGIVWYLQRHKLSRLRARAGEVYIMLNGVNTNGVWFGWGFSELGWRLRDVRRKTISTGPAKSMEVLEFKCAAHDSHALNRRAARAWRIPIPAGKGAAADRIIERLFAAMKSSAKDGRAQRSKPSSAHRDLDNGTLGHDFAGDVCRKCGNTVEAVLNFKWKCKE